MLKPENIDDYISTFPEETQLLLEQMRNEIKKSAPKAEEIISYGMPGFKLNGLLVWFAGYKNHIGFYPKPAAILVFKKELGKYKTSKGAIQFPTDEPLPLALIRKIVKYRVEENLAAKKSKGK